MASLSINRVNLSIPFLDMLEMFFSRSFWEKVSRMPGIFRLSLLEYWFFPQNILLTLISCLNSVLLRFLLKARPGSSFVSLCRVSVGSLLMLVRVVSNISLQSKTIPTSTSLPRFVKDLKFRATFKLQKYRSQYQEFQLNY